jgi:hypothetical protein
MIQKVYVPDTATYIRTLQRTDAVTSQILSWRVDRVKLITLPQGLGSDLGCTRYRLITPIRYGWQLRKHRYDTIRYFRDVVVVDTG